MLLHEDALLVTNLLSNCVRRLRLSDGVELARWEGMGMAYGMALAGERLFVTGEGKVNVQGKVNVLEPRTLMPHGGSGNSSFGECKSPVACAVHGDELYVADNDDTKRGTVQVYGLDGQYHRIISGDFGCAAEIAIRHGRIYLIEDGETEPVTEDGKQLSENIWVWAGRRLLVLELNGEIQQEVRISQAGSWLSSLCVLADSVLL